MAFGTHVFISYAHDDNLATQGNGWVDDFHARLRIWLEPEMRRVPLKIWRDVQRLSDNDVFDPKIMEALPDSAVMVAVVTESYLMSPWCQREVNAFCDAAEKNLGLSPGHQSRLIKVLKRPLPADLPVSAPVPPPLKDATTGKRFFVRVAKNEKVSNDEADKAVPLDARFGAEFEAMLNQKMFDLATDIANVIRALPREAPAATAMTTSATSAPSPAQVPSPPGTGLPTVYLALCGEDRSDDRDALRRELVGGGYRVLPEGGLRLAEGAFQAEVAQLLEGAALSVHLLGASAGVTPADGDDSIVAIQCALALERERAAGLRRLIWLPADTEARKATHRAFLENIRSKAELLGNAELISADIGKLKEQLHRTLDALAAAAASPPAEPGGDGPPTIYVIIDGTDLDLVESQPLRRALEARWRVLKPLSDGSPAELREDNERCLRDCDVVLVYYGNGTESWKRAVDSDLLRAPKLRAGRPFRARFTWLAGKETRDKRDQAGAAGVIDARGGFGVELLAPVLEAAAPAGNGVPGRG